MTSSLRSKELSTWMRILRIDPFITVLPLVQKRWRHRNGRTQFCISYPPTPSSLSRFIVTKSSVWILPRLLLLLAIPLLLLWFFLCLQDEKYFFVKLWSSKTIFPAFWINSSGQADHSAAGHQLTWHDRGAEGNAKALIAIQCARTEFLSFVVGLNKQFLWNIIRIIIVLLVPASCRGPGPVSAVMMLMRTVRHTKYKADPEANIATSWRSPSGFKD